MTIKKIHSSIDFEKFKDMYINKSFNNLDFNIIYYQKLYLKCFLLYNDIKYLIVIMNLYINLKKDLKISII